MEGVTKIVKAVDSGNSRREMAKKQMEIDCNWGNLLYPAPNSIAVLGMLMAVSTKEDFSLETNIPTGGFQYAKHPSSFRASLVQISDDGCNAFTTAHKNMDRIYLYSLQFEQNVKRLVPILLKGSNEQKTQLAPIFLKDMCKDAKSCRTAAEEIETSFSNLTYLVQEISQAASGAKKVHEEQLKKCEKQKQSLILKEKEVKEKKEKMEKEKQKLLNDITKAKVELEQEYDNLPRTGKNVLLSVVDTFTSLLSTPIAIIQGTCEIVHSFSRASDRDSKGETNTQERMVERVAFENATQILSLVGSLCEIVDEIHSTLSVSLKQSEIDPSKRLIEEKTYIIKKLSEIYQQQSPLSNEKAVVACRSLCKRGIAICENLMTESMYQREQSLDRITAETKTLSKDAEEFKTKADRFLSPGSSSTTVNASNSKFSFFRKSAVERENETAMIKIKAKEKEYRDIRDKEKKANQEIDDLEQKYAITIRKLSTTDIQKIEFEQILDILNEGIKSLSELKTQWSRFVTFFSSITNRIEICLDTNTQQLDSIVSCQIETGTKKLILEIAANVNAVSCAAGQTAKCYTEISSRHLIGNIAGLSGMIAYNPEKDKEELDKSKSELLSKCDEAKEEITKLVKERHKQTLHEIDAILARYESLEEQLLPIDENRKQEIEHNIEESDSNDFKWQDENESDYI